MLPFFVAHKGMIQQLILHLFQGPVVQSLIKLILDQWKLLFVIYLPLRRIFSED